MKNPDCYKCRWRTFNPNWGVGGCVNRAANVKIRKRSYPEQGGTWPDNFCPDILESCDAFERRTLV